MIAALYVRPDGPYAGRPDVDAWDEARDARQYAGPWPVVAHPPCARWGNLWWSARHRGLGLGDDDGCFAAALAAVRRWGGVLEHPQGSRAWERFRLIRPQGHARWTSDLVRPGEHSAEVDQLAYGHRARKRTWLYAVLAAERLPALRIATGRPSAICVSGPGLATPEERLARQVELMGRRERELTPELFAELLLSIARAAG